MTADGKRSWEGGVISNDFEVAIDWARVHDQARSSGGSDVSRVWRDDRGDR